MKHLPRSKEIRLITLVVLLVTALLLSSCSSSIKPIESSELEMTVVGQCEGFDIYYEELRYVAMSYRDIMESYYGKGIWDNADTAAQYLPELTERVMSNLTANYAVLAHCKTFMIDINHEAIQEAVQEKIDEMVNDLGGRKKYIQGLKELYLTDHLVRFTIGTDLCQNELMYAMMDLDLIISNQLDFLTYAQEGGFCAVYQIFIENNEGESIEDNRARAEEVLEKIERGEEFTDLIGSSYNEDVMMVSTPYYFTRGEYAEEYEDTAFDLEVGEVSDIIQLEEGFYILQRQPLEQDYLVNNLGELLQRYQYAQVETLVRDLQKDIVVELNDFGKSINLLTITMDDSK